MPLVAAEIAALIDRVWPNGCCNPDPVLLLLEQARAAAMTDDDARKTNQTNTTMNKQQNRSAVERDHIMREALMLARPALSSSVTLGGPGEPDRFVDTRRIAVERALAYLDGNGAEFDALYGFV